MPIVVGSCLARSISVPILAVALTVSSVEISRAAPLQAVGAALQFDATTATIDVRAFARGGRAVVGQEGARSFIEAGLRWGLGARHTEEPPPS